MGLMSTTDLYLSTHTSADRDGILDRMKISRPSFADQRYTPTSVEQAIFELEVELLEIIDPGYRAQLDRFIAGVDVSEAVIDPARDPSEGIVG